MPEQDLFLQRALIEEGLVDDEQLDAARRHGAEHEISVIEALVRLKTVESRQVAMVKADISEVAFVDLADFETCFANSALVPRNIADQYCAFPLFMIDGVLTLAMDDPLNLEATDQIRQMTRSEVEVVLCDGDQIRAMISRVYNLGVGRTDDPVPASQTDVAEVDEASQPVVAAVNQLLADAVQQRASDVHINPDEHELYIRYRIDGVLHEKQGPPLSMHAGIVQRLKVMSNLDLTQTRRPQDGKFRFRHGRSSVDVRISIIPTVSGENAVLRLLANAQMFQNFHELGMPAPLATEIDEVLEQPNGMLLVTGPTGSGKTTTLYTALAKLNDPSRNVMTIEDPVEIRMPLVRQVQVNHEIGMVFATALRSMLRQDPDVVLVGEIRDHETATIALQAALTGHLVLSTLHTNDAVGAIARLRDYELPPFVINSSLLGVVAQRLVRRVCPHCAAPDEPDDVLRHRFDIPSDASGFQRGKGCARCGQSGYRGRTGLYEFLRFLPEIKRLVEEQASPDRIRLSATRAGMRLMWQFGLEKAQMGETTLEEVAKVATLVDLARVPTGERLIA